MILMKPWADDTNRMNKPWAYCLVDLVELVKSELLQFNQVCFTIRQTHVGKGLFEDEH